MPDTSIIFPGLFFDESEDHYEEARTDNSADDASDDSVKVYSDDAEKCTCHSTTDDSQKDVDDYTVVALHDESCEPSADCTDEKRYDQID
jgi:hypothetical protein